MDVLMGHYNSEMGSDSKKLASWFDWKREPSGAYAAEKNFPYWGAGDKLVYHGPCGQVFFFDIWSEKDTTAARKHHYSCPALHDTVNPGPIA